MLKNFFQKSPKILRFLKKQHWRFFFKPPMFDVETLEVKKKTSNVLFELKKIFLKKMSKILRFLKKQHWRFFFKPPMFDVETLEVKKKTSNVLKNFFFKKTSKIL
ncbi:MAG: hypothetical protein B6I24_00095 [Bacteroidetes bacterium 4572_128]|nr:MAG: hypothetical protein B6I24_00095 [Bacteroidetes bacterium 4572_128]